MLRRQGNGAAWAARLLFQIGGSVAATVIASALFAVMPKPWTEADGSAIEKTSGGKFAARAVTDVPDDPTVPLRAPPLPLLTFTPDDTPLATFALDGVWQEATSAAAVLDDKSARSRIHAALRNAAHRAVEMPPAATVRRAEPDAAAEPNVASADDGLVGAVLGSARSLWSGTVSAGGSLITRFMPR